MKKKTPDTEALAESFGLVANAVAGSWAIDIDESIEGAERWFAQIDGPSLYVNFQIASLDIIDEIAGFLRFHLCPDACNQPSKLAEAEDMLLSHFGGASVTLIWDSETNERCFIVISADSELSVRLCIDRGGVEELAKAFEEIRDELRIDGRLPAISK